MDKKQNDLDLTLEITGEKGQGRRESNNDFSVRVARAVAKASEADWDDLPLGIQSWFNEAAVSLNANAPDEVQDIPGLAGGKKETASGTKRATLTEDKPKRGGRRGSSRASKTEEKGSDDDDGEVVEFGDVEEGDVIYVKRSRGEAEGKVVEIKDGNLIIDTGGRRNTRVAESAVKKIIRKSGGGDASSAPDGNSIEFADAKEGMRVSCVTKDGEEVTGEVVDVQRRAIVIDTGINDEVRVSKGKIQDLVELGGKSDSGTASSTATVKTAVGKALMVVVAAAEKGNMDEDEVIDSILDTGEYDDLEGEVEDLVAAVAAMIK